MNIASDGMSLTQPLRQKYALQSIVPSDDQYGGLIFCQKSQQQNGAPDADVSVRRAGRTAPVARSVATKGGTTTAAAEEGSWRRHIVVQSQSNS